ncbi:ComEA family DNA-binding protein [Neptuniibacter caesariensis]|uniref:Competence protein ComEA n=1 Tax=Neptuniibacter caesariensis TaxID=207954 RepID=A0A7U8C6H5_NEPCE|nr:helix-hairpin-helix domain-containing protein [Neptuniibacter caesariensis]EAR60799.1 hypothetical protein MED92_16170 [Oceanospirillum sp. MED92] [Neptuniibacter caesariensis]
MKLRSLRALVLALICLVPVSAFAELLDINTASVEQLSTNLKGIGHSKAEAIVAHREQHGPFKTVDELTQVKGIGKATVSKNLDVMTVTMPKETEEVAVKK